MPVLDWSLESQEDEGEHERCTDHEDGIAECECHGHGHHHEHEGHEHVVMMATVATMLAARNPGIMSDISTSSELCCGFQ